jgi:cytosine/adenosine deaminase-related metal-dependent hydrolase
VPARLGSEARDVTPRDIQHCLTAATADVAAARTAGLADRAGSLTPGKAADVILVRADGPGLAPVHSPAEALVLAAHPGLVDTVLVAGQAVKRHGRLLADVTRARDLAAATAARFTGTLASAG